MKPFNELTKQQQAKAARDAVKRCRRATQVAAATSRRLGTPSPSRVTRREGSVVYVRFGKGVSSKEEETKRR